MSGTRAIAGAMTTNGDPARKFARTPSDRCRGDVGGKIMGRKITIVAMMMTAAIKQIRNEEYTRPVFQADFSIIAAKKPSVPVVAGLSLR